MYFNCQFDFNKFVSSTISKNFNDALSYFIYLTGKKKKGEKTEMNSKFDV